MVFRRRFSIFPRVLTRRAMEKCARKRREYEKKGEEYGPMDSFHILNVFTISKADEGSEEFYLVTFIE